MKYIGNCFVYYLSLLFLIYSTHIIFIGVLGLFLELPLWANEASFYIIAGVYTYLIIKYRIHVKITMHKKTVFEYENRKRL